MGARGRRPGSWRGRGRHEPTASGVRAEAPLSLSLSERRPRTVLAARGGLAEAGAGASRGSRGGPGARLPAPCPSRAPGGGVGARPSRDSQPQALPKDWERTEPAHFQMARTGSRTGTRARRGGSESARQTKTKEEHAKATSIGAGCWVRSSRLSPAGERRSPLGDPDVCQVSRSYRSALRDVSFPTSGLGQVLFSLLSF